MGGADAGTGLHGHHALNGHGHVDDHAVALLHATRLQRIRKLRHLGQQFLVGDLGDLPAVGFKNDRGLVLNRRAHVAVQAVERGVQFAVLKPLVERLVGLVQHFGEGLAPGQGLAGALGPEAFEVFFGLGTQGVVGVHPRNPGGLADGLGRFEDAVFDQGGFNRRRRRGHVQVSSGVGEQRTRRMCARALTSHLHGLAHPETICRNPGGGGFYNSARAQALSQRQSNPYPAHERPPSKPPVPRAPCPT